MGERVGASTRLQSWTRYNESTLPALNYSVVGIRFLSYMRSFSQMATWHPLTRVTPNNEIVNDEAEAVFHILPLRCVIDQKAVRFARAFFRSGDDIAPTSTGDTGTRSNTASNRKPSKSYAVP